MSTTSVGGWSSDDRRGALDEAVRRWGVQAPRDRLDQRDHDLYGMGARQGFALGAEWWKSTHAAAGPHGEPSDAQESEFQCGNCGAGIPDDHIGPNPSDAQVEAALHAWMANDEEYGDVAMRAALRAAWRAT